MAARKRVDHLPLYTAEQMRLADGIAIDKLGIPSAVFMERAGGAVAEFLMERFSQQPAFLVLAGKGNNGGDGFVAARHLHEAGAAVEVLALGRPSHYSGDSLTNLRVIKKLGVPVGHAPSADQLNRALLRDCVIVDAIFGTGFSGTPRGKAAEFIRAAAGAAEQLGNPVVAVDIASGVDASTGEASSICIRADATVTFHLPKVGHFVEPGGYGCGELVLSNIGIPEDAGPAPDHYLTDPREVADRIPPKMAQDHKFTTGRVLVVGGSTGLTGAACLTARSALRAGAGVVTAAIPETLNPVFEQKLLEVMTLPLPDTGEGAISPAAAKVILEASASFDCVALGPGLGRQAGSAQLVEAVLASCPVPVVLDADGLNAISGRLGTVKRRKISTVLTPHAGELARLLRAPADEVSMSRLKHARRAAAEAGAVIALKGSATIVTDGETVLVNSSGNPGLATAGSGDVLTGIIAALIARDVEPFEAAAAAVWLHGSAAELAAADLYADNLIASDLIDYLPLAFAALYGDDEDGHDECRGDSCRC